MFDIYYFSLLISQRLVLNFFVLLFNQQTRHTIIRRMVTKVKGDMDVLKNIMIYYHLILKINKKTAHEPYKIFGERMSLKE